MRNGRFKKNEARYIPFVIPKRYTANELMKKRDSKNKKPQERMLKDDEQ